MYLDSAFDANGYRYGKSFPKFIQPGLEFVQGAMIALDSIPLPNGNIRAEIFDSKASVQNINWLLANHRLDSLDYAMVFLQLFQQSFQTFQNLDD